MPLGVGFDSKHPAVAEVLARQDANKRQVWHHMQNHKKGQQQALPSKFLSSGAF